jgi:hypothetical protein
MNPPDELTGGFAWKAIKIFCNKLRRFGIDNTPLEGHYINVDDRPGSGKQISVDTAALAAGLGPGLGGSVTVTVEDASGYAPGAGVGSVSNVDTLTFDSNLFEIYDGGGGQAVVKLKTTDCSGG